MSSAPKKLSVSYPKAAIDARVRTRCYKFGIRFTESATPDFVREQLAASGKLYNSFIEVQRACNEAFRSARRKFSPPYGVLEKKIERVSAQIDVVLDRIKARSKSARKRVEHADDSAAMVILKAKRKEVGDKMRALRTTLKAEPKWIYILEELDADRKVRLRAVSKTRECLPHTAYMTQQSSEQAVRMASKGGGDPRFKAHCGEGRIGIQFHAAALTPAGRATFAALSVLRKAHKALARDKKLGLITKEAFVEQVRAEGLLDRRAFDSACAPLPRKAVLRVGALFGGDAKLCIERPQPSNARRRRPVPGRIELGTTSVPFTLVPYQLKRDEREDCANRIHPRLRDDAEVKEAYITRTKVGQQYTTHLCLVVKEQAPKPVRSAALCVVVPHFRMVEGVDGQRRVQVATVFDGKQVHAWFLPNVERRCYKKQDNGEKIWTTKVVNPLSVMAHADDVRRRESTNFDTMRDALRAWLQENEGALPEWLTEMRAGSGIDSKHFVARRLVGLMHVWGKQRFAADHEVFPRLQADVKRNLMHYYNWWSHEQRKAAGWRDKIYEQFAYRLVNDSRFGRVLVVDIGLAKKARKAPPEEGDDGATELRMIARRVALSHLVGAVGSAAANAGALVGTVKGVSVADPVATAKAIYAQESQLGLSARVTPRAETGLAAAAG